MLRVGQVLDGFCGGYFGRDSYSPKRVEAMGVDWVVVRNDEGRVECAFVEPEFLERFVETPA